MTALCQFVMATEDNIVPAFEGIDPPLLDPLMVEHFNNLQSPEPLQSSSPRNGSNCEGSTVNLQGLSLDDLIKLVTQLCESDPSFSEQILSALNGDTSCDEKDESGSRPNSNEATASEPMIVESEPPLPDTNTLLKTLNQSFLLQEYNNTLALQIAQANTRLSSNGLDSSNPAQSSVLLNAESIQEAMKSNLFVMENKGNNFVPLKEFRRPGPKYTRKNFSPEQIEGLEAAFQEHRFVKKDLRKELARKLNLSERSISYWFQNKRARSKPPITMSSEAALKAAQQQHGLEPQQQLDQQQQSQQDSLVAALQQTIQQSCAT